MSLLLMCADMVRAENPENIAAIKATARNYMESWYQGDVKRMKGNYGEPGLRHTTASDMIRYTKSGYGVNLW